MKTTENALKKGRFESTSARKPKKIAFFGIKYYPSRGGTSRVAENLIRHLCNQYEITVYCYKDPLAKNHIQGVRTVEIPEIKLGSLGVFLYYFFCYCHIRWKADYDIVHAHKIDSFFFLDGLTKTAKVIATAHEAPYKRDKWGRLAKWFFRLNEKRFLRFKGIKTAISKPLCDFYQEQYNKTVRYIPNGINPAERKSKKGMEHFWPDSLPNDTPFVLFAARRIMGTKGLHTMLKALKRNKYEGAVFIAGELDDFPAYSKKMRELAEGLNAHFLGFVSPLPVLLQLVDRCDYFVFPSETEGMSIMLLEVASTGKPIIASDIPENKEVFGDTEVVYFKDKDVEDLAGKLSWAESNPSALRDFGHRAKAKVDSEYTWSQIAVEYRSIYESVLERESL